MARAKAIDFHYDLWSRSPVQAPTFLAATDRTRRATSNRGAPNDRNWRISDLQTFSLPCRYRRKSGP
jgi:hypothetical protein